MTFATPIPYGDDAFFIRCNDARTAQHIATHLRSFNTWQETVPGLDSVVVTFDPLADKIGHISGLLNEQLICLPESQPEAGKIISLAVDIGSEAGEDFEDVLNQLDTDKDQFLQTLLSSTYHVDMMGFTPGFAYMSGLPKTFTVPRLKTPRQRVPAGSIGIAAGYIGLYALQGPGGWPLIGKCTTPLFDPSKESPFTLQPGDRIQLRLAPS